MGDAWKVARLMGGGGNVWLGVGFLGEGRLDRENGSCGRFSAKFRDCLGGSQTLNGRKEDEGRGR